MEDPCRSGCLVHYRGKEGSRIGGGCQPWHSTFSGWFLELVGLACAGVPCSQMQMEMIEQLQQELYTERQKRLRLEELLPATTLQDHFDASPAPSPAKLLRHHGLCKRFSHKYSVVGMLQFVSRPAEAKPTVFFTQEARAVVLGM